MGLETFCSVYIDDIIESEGGHVDHLRQIFQRLRRYCLKLHPKKCKFAQGSVEYLGTSSLRGESCLTLGELELFVIFPSPPQ